MEWILCKDRMPTTDEECIVSITDDTGDSPFFYSSVGWYISAIDKWVVNDELNGMVEAWMPLPRPYKPPKIACTECQYLELKGPYGICGKNGHMVDVWSKCRFGKKVEK